MSRGRKAGEGNRAMDAGRLTNTFEYNYAWERDKKRKREYYREHREKMLERSKAHYWANREKKLEYQKEYRERKKRGA